MMPTLKIKRLHEEAMLPTKAYEGDFGYDLFAVDTVVVPPGKTVMAKTGIAFGFPDGWGGIIKARSSQGKAGVDIFGGVVDNGYTGEVMVGIHNANQGGEEDTIVYERGNKIAQLVLVQVVSFPIEEVTSLDQTERGDKRFASSGQ